MRLKVQEHSKKNVRPSGKVDSLYREKNSLGVHVMKEGKVLWVSPEAPAQKTVGAERHSLSNEGALRLGILDNAKSNADHLLEMLVESLQAATPVSSVIRRRKPGPAFPAKPEILDDLAREADFVISAMAD